MNVFDNSIRQINGPINIIRLEGVVNGIRKIIYVFMDMHEDVRNQTECENVYSKDVQSYFAESFYNISHSSDSKSGSNDKIYDFFLEISPLDTENLGFGFGHPEIVNLRDKYIRQVRKLFRRLFKYDVKKNEVSISDYFNNVRLHYMDIREYFDDTHIIDMMMQDISDNTNYMLKNRDLYVNILDKNEKYYDYLKTHFSNILEIIHSYQTSKNKPFEKISVIKYHLISDSQSNRDTVITPEQEGKKHYNNLNYLINKLYNSYQNNNVQKVIIEQIKILDDEILDLIKECDKQQKEMEQLRHFAENQKDRFFNVADSNSYACSFGYGFDKINLVQKLSKIRNEQDYFFIKYISTFLKFMDLYFLRRFLDKSYITNAITYTGGYHSRYYIHMLIKHFNFNITHVAYSVITNMDELNSTLKNIPVKDYYKFLLPEYQSQCSDVTDFPKNFT